MDRTLVVELDQTLLKSSLLSELGLKLFKKDPVHFLKGITTQLIRGKTQFRYWIAEHIVLEPEELPYNQKVSEFLLQQKKEGNTLILTSDYNIKTVKEIADHLGFFDLVIAHENGKDKLSRIREYIGENSDFDFVGQKNGNREIWDNARRVHFTNNRVPGNKDRAGHILTDAGSESQSNIFFLLLRELRIHQWVKNILVFLPFILAHEWANIEKWTSAAFAFISFSLVASSVYIINDLWDIDSDRQHAYKKNRPFAAGELSILTGLILVPILFSSGITVSWSFVSAEFAYILLLYWALTTSYTFYLKREVLLDVLILAGLYTIRLFGGAVATDVVISEWLMGFSLFFFLSLALIKRYTELSGKDLKEDQVNRSRGYIKDDLSLLMAVGVSSGLMSVLIFALYINSPDVTRLYGNHKVLWFVVPLLLYWIIRIWKLAKRGGMHDDPVVFAIRDRVSVLTGMIIIFIVILSTYF